jgi:DNA-directed RNA polymerase subunit M/transcription elongation factor TFIIS
MCLIRSVKPDDLLLCREVEAHCHAVSSTVDEYNDHVIRCAFNLKENKEIGINVVYESDSVLSLGTIVGRIYSERQARTLRFERMLQEKYEALDDEKFQAIVRCRRCGSEDVSWEEKQTRSADEGATVFCVCTTCKNRWVMR